MIGERNSEGVGVCLHRHSLTVYESVDKSKGYLGLRPFVDYARFGEQLLKERL